MFRDRPAGRYERDRRCVVRSCRHSATLRRECLALDTVDQRPAMQRRERHRQRRFREAVHRQLRLAPKSIRRKTFRKAIQRIGIHRLRAIQRRAQLAQIQPLDILVGNLSYAQLISKIRSRGNRSAILLKRLQPFLRTREKGQRRHHCQRHSEMQQRQPCADQPHVVIKRKPAHAHIARPQFHDFADRANVREQIRMRQHHALGIARRPGSVLQQRNVARLYALGCPSGATATRPAMVAALYPRRRSVFLRRPLPRANARAVSKVAPQLLLDETSAANTLPRFSKSPTAATRTPRCDPRGTADKSAQESHPPARFPHTKQKTRAKSAASAPHGRLQVRRAAPTPPRNAAPPRTVRQTSASHCVLCLPSLR